MTEPEQPGVEPRPVDAPDAPPASQGATPPAPEAPPADDAGWLLGTAAPLPATPPPDPPKRTALKRLGIIAAGGAGVLAFLAWKFVLPLVLVGVAGQVFGSTFGGPYNRLPSDVRSGFEQRFETAVGDSFDDQTEAEQEARLVALVEGGLPRLDDAHIETNFRLTVKGLQAVDETSCGAIARSFFEGAEAPDDAFTALIATLSDAELQQWFEIRILALEAAARGTPAAVSVDDATVDPLFDKLFAAMSPTDVDTFVQMGNGGTIDDARLCSAARGIYGSVLLLAPQEVVIFARYDVTE